MGISFMYYFSGGANFNFQLGSVVLSRAIVMIAG